MGGTDILGLAKIAVITRRQFYANICIIFKSIVFITLENS